LRAATRNRAKHWRSWDGEYDECGQKWPKSRAKPEEITQDGGDFLNGES
jgi:hypothetical protein